MARNVACGVLGVLCLVLRFVWLLLQPKAVLAAKLMATQSQRRAIRRDATARVGGSDLQGVPLAVVVDAAAGVDAGHEAAVAGAAGRGVQALNAVLNAAARN